jgi:isopenicillin N synthase-like dioxygenase
MTEKAIRFFDLPLEQKLEIEMVNSKHFLGYARLGTEITAQKQDFREQCDVRATPFPHLSGRG